MTTRELAWEKCVSPFDNVKQLEEIKDVDPEEFGLDEETFQDKTISTQKYMVTPLGLIPMDDENDPHKTFNFWIAHTNFDVDELAAKIFNDTPGVESFEVFTRYRVRISVGKCFSENQVKADLMKRLNAKPSRHIRESMGLEVNESQNT